MSDVATRRPRKTWDLILTIVLLVGYLVLTALISGSGLFLAFASDSCGASTVCDTDAIGGAMLLVLAGVWIPFVIFTVLAILLLVLRRVAFWLPIVGGLIAIGVLVGGYAIITSAIHPG